MSFFNSFLGVFSNGVDYNIQGSSNISLWYTSNYGLPQEQALGGIITPLKFERLKADIQTWRDALSEAENPFYPHRVKLQNIYMDLILNAHIYACMERRRNITKLREFNFVDINDNNKVDADKFTDIKKMFEKNWFLDFVSYCIDAKFYGYSLISLGDIVDNSFYKLNTIRRWNISPDREIVSTFIYMIDGIKFLDKEHDLSLQPNGNISEKAKKYYNDNTKSINMLSQDEIAKWHIWVTTPNELGYGQCGYGLLNTLAPYGIWLRRMDAYNSQYIEIYGQPFRYAKSNKEGADRQILFNAIKNMGASASAIIGLEDEIEFIQSNATNVNIYADFEERTHKKISKIILGHADVLDSVPGKLGNNNALSPAQIALNNIESEDGLFIENIVNEQLIPRMRVLGFNIPNNCVFKYSNNDELEEQKNRDVAYKLQFAQFCQTMHNAGLHIPSEYVEEQLGIDNVVDNMQMQPMISGNNNDNNNNNNNGNETNKQ